MSQTKSSSSLPLDGVQILMFGGAAAYCGRLLAGFGATTVLVEPLQGVPERRLPPFAPGPLGSSSSLSFAFNAAGLRSIALDATTADGAEVLRVALATADACVDVLSWEPRSPWVAAVQRLIRDSGVAPVCALGPSGPLADLGADDLLIQAASGHLYVSGFAEGEPTPIPVEMGKLQVGLLGAVAVLSTLMNDTLRPDSSVAAQAALTLTTLQTSNPGFLTWRQVTPKRAGAEGLGGTPYQCKDGYVSFTVPGERWGVFVSWLDELGISRHALPTELDGQVDSMRAALALARSAVEELASRFTKREIYHAAQERGILCMPMNTLQEVLSDEHLTARRFFIDDHLGRADLVSPFRTEPCLWRLTPRAPTLGEFTETLCVELGYSRSEIEALVGMGAVSCGH